MATSSGDTNIAKAGWLYRQSTVLHRWKKNWFVLDRGGELRYFENPDQSKAEDRLIIRAVVTQIKTGPECRRVDKRPEGAYSDKAYMELCLRDNKESMLLCAESVDDMKAWQIALEDARTMPSANRGPEAPIPPPGYMHGSGNPYVTHSYGYNGYGYPGQVLAPPPGVHQVYSHPGGSTTTVIHQSAPPVAYPTATQQIVYVDDHPYRRYRRHRGYYGGMYAAPLFFW